MKQVEIQVQVDEFPAGTIVELVKSHIGGDELILEVKLPSGRITFLSEDSVKFIK